ncbi:MAG: hypothetical protein QFX35_06325 [Candidatus Verstraetearchaeota archaeon]|nr:hypothetical protein [Candidatus Verstraetearchaeota archaeon]
MAIGLGYGNGIRSSEGDPLAKITSELLDLLGRAKGTVEYEELERWAEERGVGKYTLRMLLNDLVEEGVLVAPEGFLEQECELEPPRPKKIGIRRADQKDVDRMKDYLSEYWSVGLLRLFEDMVRAGVKDVNEALKEVIRLGYAELSRIGVVNAEPLRRGKSGSRSLP